jgi:hypothetical protein
VAGRWWRDTRRALDGSQERAVFAVSAEKKLAQAGALFDPDGLAAEWKVSRSEGAVERGLLRH